jgi:outer membrane protein OmpA-like peptidoglycan-associated protein
VVTVSLNRRAQLGKGVPSLEVHIHERIAGFEVRLQRSDGKDVVVRGGGPPGVTRTIQLTQPEGRFGYRGVLTVNLPNGERPQMPLEFEAELFGPLKLSVDNSSVDVAARRVVLRSSRPATRAEIEVVLDTGEIAAEQEIPFDNAPAGSPLEITWPELPGRVLKVAVRVHDAHDFFAGVELFPWQLDIPHEELQFPSGKTEVPPSEQPKLEDSLQKIADAIRRYGRFAELKLYIAGHSDTVGPAELNRNLSLGRARSIGAWFRKRGIRIPIHYAGFGEDALLVGTPDETDEPRNRRAEYIISVEEPVIQGSAVKARWHKL